MKNKYKHYGHTSFDKSAFEPIKNIPMLTKPNGGFWACKDDAEASWKEYCDEATTISIDENNFFCFVLSDDAKVLKIDSYEILEGLPQFKNSLRSVSQWVFLDFEKLSLEYDAIEVLISEDHAIYDALYGWDVDSILIMNPDIIIS